MKEKNEMKNCVKRQTGITIIALIITIIIMLILVAVSINVLIQNNLIGATKTAAKKWQGETDKEKTIGSEIIIEDKTYESIEDYIKGKEKIVETHDWKRTGDVITCDHCDEEYTIGDSYEYTCIGDGTSEITGELSGMLRCIEDTSFTFQNVNVETGNQTVKRDTNTAWVILGIEDQNNNGTNETLLITTAKPTNDSYYLYGEYAYNNGINILNKVCKDLYGENARGMTVTDVNNCFNYTPTGAWYGTGYSDARVEGFTTSLNNLSIWDRIKSSGTYTPDGVNTEEKLGSYKLTECRYWVWTSTETKLNFPDNSYINITDVERNVIFGNNLYYYYWLANCAVGAVDDRADFGQYDVCCGTVQSNWKFTSYEGLRTSRMWLRTSGSSDYLIVLSNFIFSNNDFDFKKEFTDCYLIC